MRQSNLFEYLGNIQDAIEQEVNKLKTEQEDSGTEDNEVVEEVEDTTLYAITSRAYRRAVKVHDAVSADIYWKILKEMTECPS